MKTLRILFVALVCLSVTSAYSQKTKTESFKVSGECGTCKKKIEKSAREAGASYASWDQHTKILKVSYASGIDVAAIQQRIADAGYDTPKFRAPDEAYNQLDKCCQYDRVTEKKAAACCSSTDCKMKDGKCADMAACKEKGCCKEDGDCATKSCCEKAKATEKNGDPGQ